MTTVLRAVVYQVDIMLEERDSISSEMAILISKRNANGTKSSCSEALELEIIMIVTVQMKK